jgi:hypothetical protein
MEITVVLGAQAVRFLDAAEVPPEQRIPLYSMIRALQERYFFVHVPSRPDETDFEKGLTILHGWFENKTVDKCQMFQRGVLCEAKTSTDHCDRFIDDLLEFAINMGLPIKKQNPPDRAYFSSLEVHIEGNFNKATKFASLESIILDKLHSYSHTTPFFPVTGFKMGIDSTIASVPVPADFAFERRAGRAFHESIFASWGPLRTQDHVDVLHVVEAILTK